MGPADERVWSLAGGRTLALGGLTRVMGILNVTDDSFSDGGRYRDFGKAVARGLEMAERGADIIDVGGESTRPGSLPVPEGEEIDRTVPVIAELCRRTDTPVSIDTTKAAVARAALDAGAAIINDISGFTFDAEMPGLAAESGAGLVVMHIRGTPETMQQDPRFGDVLAEVRDELRERTGRLLELGVAPKQIVIDPGIGFGKRFEDNLVLLAGLREFDELGFPVLAGCSRKSFLGQISGRDPADRLFETVATSVLAAAAGCHIVRVHDVEANVRALKAAGTVLGSCR